MFQGFFSPRVLCRPARLRRHWDHQASLKPPRRTTATINSLHQRFKGKSIPAKQRINAFQARNFAGPLKPNSPPVATSLSEAFRQATLYNDQHRVYKLLRVPKESMDSALELWSKSMRTSLDPNTTDAPSSPFGCFLVDKDEITILISSDVYHEYCSCEGSTQSNIIDNGINYRLFTFDNVVLHPSLVGFMAVITEALAVGGISVLPYAAYSTDHLFVAESDAEKAQIILKDLSQKNFPSP